MKPSLSDINNSSIIILDAGKILTIKINKIQNSVTQLFWMGEEVNKDITNELISVESQYTIGNMTVDTPYTMGMVIAKLLRGEANKKCIKMLNVFDKIVSVHS